MEVQNDTALVVGAGISGIAASLGLAELGCRVVLIDRAPGWGGLLSRLDYQFPTNHCGMCRMLPLIDRDECSGFCLRKGFWHERIDVRSSTELKAVEKTAGGFRVTLSRTDPGVDPERCAGCGECARVCPVEAPDEFNSRMGTRKAIYRPVPHRVFDPYIIDWELCNRCGACVDACPTGAVKMFETGRAAFRVLIVDDELVMRDSLKEWLLDEGYGVDMAGSGGEALDLLSKKAFDLILLDIRMAGLDGLDVLRRVKEDHPEITVIMMTAYATVDTAIKAMKVGALDYLVKPFQAEDLMTKIASIFDEKARGRGMGLDVGSIILCGGVSLFDPRPVLEARGYGRSPYVVTSLEFERILSGAGPTGGKLVRPSDGKPLEKIAWIQCVGSRNLSLGSDYCSSICCMQALKEAELAVERSGGRVSAVIHYMDLRTFGKTYNAYRERVEALPSVTLKRCMVHSLAPDPEHGRVWLESASEVGISREAFDLAVLSVGQRPAPGLDELARMLDLELGPFGLGRPGPFSLSATGKPGIFWGGGFTGMKDITDSVIQALEAAVSAAEVLLPAKAPKPEGFQHEAETPPASVEELPRIGVLVCTCGKDPSLFDCGELDRDPYVSGLTFVETLCTEEGKMTALEALRAQGADRALVAACPPFVNGRAFRSMARDLGIPAQLCRGTDIHSMPENVDHRPPGLGPALGRRIAAELAFLRHMDPSGEVTAPVERRAVVIGGGIAGMSAALTIAGQGIEVDLVEKEGRLGGNLLWLHTTLEGHAVKPLIEDSIDKINANSLINVHTNTQVFAAHGEVGNFVVGIRNKEGLAEWVRCGCVIIASGGGEARVRGFGYGAHNSVVTQKDLEERLAAGLPEAAGWNSVVMIQCAGTRTPERNYCSRICCATSLKHALSLKREHPGLDVYVLYRDMNAYGFMESYYTEARRLGVIFIPWSPDLRPTVAVDGEKPEVLVREPVIGRELRIRADLVVLAAGIEPELPPDLAEALGIGRDAHGFFEEADPKWRPVDALKEGVYACGLAASPRNITETMATARAAAQRALRVLLRERLTGGRVTAEVKHSLCARCGLCLTVCPHGARSWDSELYRININPAVCRGCGHCAAACPSGAAVLSGFGDRQMLEAIDAVAGSNR